MTISVVTCGLDTDWEAGLVAAFRGGEKGVEVVRRCVDLTELLAVAGAGLARAALVGSGLRDLDRDTLTRCAVSGVAGGAGRARFPPRGRRPRGLGGRPPLPARPPPPPGGRPPVPAPRR